MDRIHKKILNKFRGSKPYIPILLQSLMFGAGYLGTKATLPLDMHPFGISIVAGVDTPFFLTAALGSFVASFSFTSGDLFRNISSLFALISLRYIIRRWSSHKAFLPSVLGFAVALVTGLTASTEAFPLPVIAESILSGVGTFLIFKARHSFPLIHKRPSEEETIGLIFFLNVLLIGCFPINIFGFSIGRIAALTLIPTAALYGKIGGGSVCGVVTGISLAISLGDPLGGLLLALSGLLAGLFSSLSKLAMVGIMILSSMVLTLAEDFSDPYVVLLIETLLGCSFFLVMPKNICAVFSSLFSPASALPTLDGMRHLMTSRIRNAAEAIYDVSHTVDDVSSRLRDINAPSFQQTLERVEGDACDKCCLRLQCWEANRQQTLANLAAMCSDIKKEKFSAAAINEDYEMGCLRPESVCNSLKNRYDDFTQRISAEERLAQIRGVVNDQFSGISDMLYEMSTEFGDLKEFDTKTAAKTADALREYGVIPEECGCSVGQNGRYLFELKIPKTSENINRKDIVNCISHVCGRQFAAPVVKRMPHHLHITVGELPIYTAELGISQQPDSKEGKFCGDSADYFFDPKGKLYMILSDGMGSGGRAAVDGALLLGLLGRMISAGFGMDSALKISNSAMLFRSSVESLATADVTEVDLFSGKVDMYKAGAAPTLVRKDGRTGKAECHSLPAGILRDVGFDHATIQLSHNDIILMMSDGATASGTDWICAELEAWQDGSATQLAHHICAKAVRRQENEHTDDVTVMAAILRRI